MRGQDVTQSLIFSYRTLAERIPESHPLRKLRAVVDEILLSMDDAFTAAYTRTGRASIAPERLLRASLLQVLFSIRSKRQLVQHLEFNLLYRWFVGLNMDEAVWDHSSFTTNLSPFADDRTGPETLTVDHRAHQSAHKPHFQPITSHR